MQPVNVKVQVSWNEPIVWRDGTLIETHLIEEQHPNGSYRWTACYGVVLLNDNTIICTYIDHMRW